MAVHKLDIKNHILAKARAIGNTDRGFKEICSDLINAYGTDAKSRQRIANGTFLSEATIARMASLAETEDGSPYRPSGDTIERILRFFNAEVYFAEVRIQAKHQNTPKQ